MERIEKLFDFSGEFDTQLLDEVCQVAFNGTGPEQMMCMEALGRFQQLEDAWMRVDTILTRCQLTQSKTRWKTIEKSQREIIKSFLLHILKGDEEIENPTPFHKTYLKKLDMTVVELLKQEWPHDWPDFIPELIASSRRGLAACENNMQILMFLSEEIYEFSEEQMTQNKIKLLKGQMEEEFGQIYQLCMEVLEKAQTVSLISTTLDTLLRFLNWIPLQFVFESALLNVLCNRVTTPAPEFRNITIKCMTQIASQTGPVNYNSSFLLMFNVVLGSIKQSIPIDIDLAEGYEQGNDMEQEYVQNVALFFTGFLEKHLDLVEKEAPVEDVLMAHQYLVKISQIEERELASLFSEIKQMVAANRVTEAPPLGEQALIVKDLSPRKLMYAPVLTQLRVVMIDRMVKPKEVLIVENEDGEVIREFTKETDTTTLYKSMRECLVYLTHMDVVDTEEIMTRKLASQIDDSEWSRTKLNRLCWSIGSISGAMSEEAERRFLVLVIKDLLGLCDIKRGKDNKAIVASNIMYIVGQYPRFLRAHWKFLKTVVNKLFEFMHEKHEGVQDMACDTFMQICQSCKRHFVMTYPGEDIPYVNHIVENLPIITCDLTPQQTESVLEACGLLVASHPDPACQKDLLAILMQNTNCEYVELTRDSQLLENNDKVKLLGHCLKANTAACRSVGPAFVGQLSHLFSDLLVLFEACSKSINQCIVAQGPVAVRTPKVRNLRVVRKETLRLLEAYIAKAVDLQAIASDFLPPLMDHFLLCYKNSVAFAREAEILDLFAIIADRLGALFNPKVGVLLDSVLSCTIESIKGDFTEFPDIRSSFYNLLHKLIQNCFEGVVLAGIEMFDCFMITVVFGFKHTMRDISESALQISYDLFNQVAHCDPQMRDSFFQAFLLNQLQEVLTILFDADHKNGFNSQCKVAASIIALVEQNVVTVKLNSPHSHASVTSNSQILYEFLGNLIAPAYSHLAPNTVASFVKGMQAYCTDLPRFKVHVRDFLISLKEFGNDNSDLYLADRELELAAKMQAEKQQALLVPGLIKPADLPSMED
ncbi:Karyopherin transporter [Massospora cicadina]|nr:Karyopherin transporter [Massospora cicadina]